jgi:hypothetical protein
MISCMKRIPRAGLLALTPGAVAMHAALPYQLSRLGGRAGPPARTTPAVRTAGLLTVAAGASLMAWAFAGAFRRAGFANIAHARRYYGRDDQRILALYGYT